MSVDAETYYAEQRAVAAGIAEATDDWQGVPVPVADLSIRLHDRHPLRRMFREIDGVEMDFICGGPSYGDDEYVEETVVNYWVDWTRQREVVVFKAQPRHGPPKYFAVKVPKSLYANRLTYWLKTLGASSAWSLEAEETAREKLRSMLTPWQWRHYDLTGTFLETSPRSKLTYLFRRSRPTLALSPRWPDGRNVDSMRCVAALCLHPVGYYDGTWAGCMVPSDDVIAHLLLMRADEAYFWGKANHHEPWQPEAGI